MFMIQEENVGVVDKIGPLIADRFSMYQLIAVVSGEKESCGLYHLARTML